MAETQLIREFRTSDAPAIARAAKAAYRNPSGPWRDYPDVLAHAENADRYYSVQIKPKLKKPAIALVSLHDEVPVAFIHGVPLRDRLDEAQRARLIDASNGKLASIQMEHAFNVMDMFTHPDFESQGHGKALSEELIRRVRKDGFTHLISWTADVEGNRMIGIYKKQGRKFIGLFPGAYLGHPGENKLQIWILPLT